MIALRKISKKYNHHLVLEEINLEIGQGEIVGLLGPNGAGKTTTLRIISGVLPPSQGRVEISGQNLEAKSSLKKMIGFLPENNPLYPEMTVEEYLSFWSEVKEIPPGEKKKAFDFVVEHCGLAEVFYRPIGELSKGYRQRVGLSQAILTRPKILILDEPTEGLDPNQRQEIARLIKNLGEKRTVVIASHVLEELAKIVNRMVIIHQGRIVADDSPENLKKGRAPMIETEIIGENVAADLKKLEGVSSLLEMKKNYFLLELKGKKDLRKEIYQLAVRKKWTLLTLVLKEQPLEEVFAQLTSN